MQEERGCFERGLLHFLTLVSFLHEVDIPRLSCPTGVIINVMELFISVSRRSVIPPARQVDIYLGGWDACASFMGRYGGLETFRRGSLNGKSCNVDQ